MQSFEFKGVKRQVFEPEKLQNHSNKGKGKEEEKKAMVAPLVFIIATLEFLADNKSIVPSTDLIQLTYLHCIKGT